MFESFDGHCIYCTNVFWFYVWYTLWHNNPNSYQESFRWNSGYSSDYASPKEDRPSITSRVLSFFNRANERRIAKKHPPVVKVTNSSASYDSAEVNGGYEDYVFKSSKDLGDDSFDQ